MKTNTNTANKNIAIAGITGAVGQEILSLIDEKNIPFNTLKLLASAKSAGKKIQFQNKEYIIEELTEDSLENVDIALFSCGSSLSKQYKRACLTHNTIMIDNSSAFRMQPNIPLVIPEINPSAITSYDPIISNPNCSTIIMLMALYPIHQHFPIKKAIVSTYQAASGAGMQAMEELKKGTKATLENKEYQYSLFPEPYAFNVFSHNSKIDYTGYNEEERKMILETQKILGENTFDVSPTCIRVPVLRAHSESIYIEFENKIPPNKEKIIDIYNQFPGVKVVDNPKENKFPTPLESSGQYECFIGRIRYNYFTPKKAMELFVVGDQLLKGAALNAVQILELCLKP